MTFEKMLPIGSVVCTKNSQFLLMIIGCNQVNHVTRELFDYSAVIYPMGFTDERHVYMLNHENIGTVYAVGYLDGESAVFARESLRTNEKLRNGSMTVEELLGPGR